MTGAVSAAFAAGVAVGVALALGGLCIAARWLWREMRK